MRLVRNWREVLSRAWSVRVAVASAIVSAASTYWFAFADSVSPVPFMLIGVALSVLTVFARIIDQDIEK